jgi:glycosyltransferase involved in cell wall biosynthesis
MFGLPEDRCMVIKNAIDNFPGRGVYQQGQELKIIHQITPWRGLNVLLGAMQIVKNKKVTLDVYSSTQVYGDAFKEANDKDYEALYDQARKLDNVNYIGYKPNEYVLEKLSSYHMFVYPSIWEETSCISAIECMAAGHYSIVTNFGALYETCADWPTYINYEKNYKNLSIATAHTIDQVSEVLHTDKMQQHLADQQKYYERFYSWEKRKVEWTNFLTGVYNASRSK